ncbi:hypothetical protein [Paraburkholderia aromaticivorans]|uniref:hypothetical protein n=1 Tax=Paraburkholderia aromaticivorans TaxID=2026199 RepID=UPI00145613D2|nr:hypothetical protein [Paraburkholderia aromaticivorans]
MDEIEVSRYARMFVGGIAERTAASGEGTITRQEAIAQDKQACLDGADAFHTDELVRWMYDALPMYERPVDAAAQDAIIREAFGICALLAYEAIAFHSEHNYGHEALQDDLEAIAAEFGLFLLCKPGTFGKSASVILRRAS